MIIFTRKHEQILEAAKERAFKEGFELGENSLKIENTRLTEEIKKLEDERNIFRNIADRHVTKYKEILKEANEKDKKIDILRFFLRCNYNKDVARYEAIAKRTKKIRIKEKAEKKIIQLKELALAFE